MEQPGKVDNPARGQLNRENEYFSVPVQIWSLIGTTVERAGPLC